MKAKIISLLMSVLMLFTLLPVSVFADEADDTAIVTIESGTVEAGESVTLDVVMTNMQDFTNFQYQVVYDTDAFTAVSVSAGSLGSVLVEVNEGTIAAVSATPISVGDDGVLFTINLTASAEAYNGDYTVSLTGLDGTDSSRKLKNSGAHVAVEYVSGTVTVTGGQDYTAETPTITTQPVGAEYELGAEAAALTVAAAVSDGGTLSYQWYASETDSNTDGTAISGATDASYTPAAAEIGTCYYYCVVTNTIDGVTASVNSETAAVTVRVTGTVVTIESGAVAAGGSVTLNVVMTNAADFTNFQYQVVYDTDAFASISVDASALNDVLVQASDGSIVAVSATPVVVGDDGVLFSITLTASESASSGDYAISLTGTDGTDATRKLNNSGTAVDVTYVSGTVTITNETVASVQITEPDEYASGAVLTAVTAGMDDANLTVQWQRDGENITGATSAAYTLTAKDFGTTLSVTVSDASGNEASDSVAVPAIAPIVTLSTSVGSKKITVKFSAEACGSDITDYTITLYDVDGTVVATQTATEAGSVTFSDLTNQVTYTVEVSATNGVGTTTETATATPKSGGGGSSGGSSSTVSYTLSFETNGGSSLSSISRSSGTTVDLTAYEPERGEYYTFTGWYSDAALTNQVESVTLTGNTTVYAGWAFIFTDIATDAYYYDATVWAVENGVTTGTSNTTFSPSDNCTRAQVVTLLYRLAGEPEMSGENAFTDVDSDAYYYNAVLWAVANGITAGTGEGVFDPDAVCTRAQIVTFLYRYADSPATEGENAFADVESGAYYENAVVWAVGNGVTNGTGDSTFSPENACTRAQVVTFLYRAFAE